MESLGLIPAAVCVPNLSAWDKSGGKQQSEKQAEMGFSAHEMNQLRGMDGASSSLKHISTYKLSGCSKDNQMKREDEV